MLTILFIPLFFFQIKKNTKKSTSTIIKDLLLQHSQHCCYFLISDKAIFDLYIVEEDFQRVSTGKLQHIQFSKCRFVLFHSIGIYKNIPEEEKQRH